jgi:ectoine hydrolase
MTTEKTGPRLFFSQTEYDARLAKTRNAMQQQGIDVMICTDPANMAWLTGYDGWSFYVHQCVIVTMEGQPMWYGRAMDANGAKLTCYLDHDNILGYPDTYIQTTERHPMDLLAQILIDKGFGTASVGLEMDNYYFTAAAYQSLLKYMPNATFKDCNVLIHWQRAVKSRAELDMMCTAGRIVGAMHERIRKHARPGLPKNQLVAEIYDASLRGVEGIGGDYPAIVPMLPSGAEASAPHLTWDDRPFKVGEGTFFELAGSYHRYHCPLSRTIFLGKPPQQFLDAEKAVLEGMEAGLEKARAGNLCEDIASAFFAVLKKHGIIKDSRTGYPIGLAYPPDWGEHTMSLRSGDKTVLEEGMTFHFMTGLWQDNWGLEITESIAIGKAGPECLANVPRSLVIID